MKIGYLKFFCILSTVIIILTLIFGVNAIYAQSYICGNLPLNSGISYDCNNSPLNSEYTYTCGNSPLNSSLVYDCGFPLNSGQVYDCGNSPLNTGGTVCTPYTGSICNICSGNYSNCPHVSGTTYGGTVCTTTPNICNICYSSYSSCPHVSGQVYGGTVCAPFTRCNYCGGDYASCPHVSGQTYGGTVCSPYSGNICNICNGNYATCPHISGQTYGYTSHTHTTSCAYHYTTHSHSGSCAYHYTTHSHTGSCPQAFTTHSHNSNCQYHYTTHSHTPLCVIVGINAGSVSTSSITISWDSVQNASGYDIEADGTVLDNGANTSYTNSGLVPGSYHTYRVRTKYQGNFGQWSDVFTKYTLTNPINGGNVSAASNGNISASWGANGNVNGTCYTLAAFDSNNVLIKQNTWTTALNDNLSGLTPLATYKVKVKTRNGNGVESSWYEIGSIQTHKTFNYALSVSNVHSFTGKTYRVSYNTNEVELLDLCTMTSACETAAGTIAGTDINITLVQPGTIELKINKTVSSGKSWSGVINSIKFKSKISGQASLSFTSF